MNEQRRSTGYLRHALEAFVTLLGIAALTYSLITGASLLLGVIAASGCWLVASLSLLRRTGTSTRSLEDAAVVAVGVLVVLYGLFTAAGVLSAIGVVALLWIGVNVARIERGIRLGDADDAAIVDDDDR